ncbi:hypothetical protein EDD85DRAFT_800069 [Armillaria nabsnona]|nr:hypothetical protein EDD85DRAFT_800069 [Armillaria nabsnona]
MVAPFGVVALLLVAYLLSVLSVVQETVGQARQSSSFSLHSAIRVILVISKRHGAEKPFSYRGVFVVCKPCTSVLGLRLYQSFEQDVL